MEAAIITPRSIYDARCADFAQQRDEFAERWNRWANIRLLLLALALVGGGVGLWQGLPLLVALAGILLLGFVAAVVYHRRLGHLRRRYDALWSINDEGLRRLRRDWNTLPLRQPPAAPSGHPFAIDLDLLGHASLQHLLGTIYTPAGQARLQRWLLEPAAPKVIRERQASVAELAPLIDLRDELALRSRPMAKQQADYEAFLRWTEGERWLHRRPLLRSLALLLPLGLIAAFAAWAAGAIAYPLWAIFIFANIAVTTIWGGQVDTLLDEVSARQGVFRAYADMFHLLRTTSFSSPALRAAQASLHAGDTHADDQMRRLQRIMALVDIRMWQLFALLQWTTLWNVHVLALLERWQAAAGPHARSWLDALAEVEALSALGTLRYDHPDWTFPDVVDDGKRVIVGQRLGHPLLAPEKCVTNDVEVGPPGRFLLVTGSNMSGKSTLLRAIGVNVVLAQAGGPVCAASLRLPATTLATSMRVQDSLEQGVSYFMAELNRLKSVVDMAEQTRGDGERALVFLLDEILHGTNTSERQIAARAILRHLLDLDATGAVSTHDLGLVDTPSLLSNNTAVHFTETFTRGPDGPAIHFDYKLRTGIATSTNALKLMEIVGLRLPEVEDEATQQIQHAAQ